MLPLLPLPLPPVLLLLLLAGRVCLPLQRWPGVPLPGQAQGRPAQGLPPHGLCRNTQRPAGTHTRCVWMLAIALLCVCQRARAADRA